MGLKRSIFGGLASLVLGANLALAQPKGEISIREVTWGEGPDAQVEYFLEKGDTLSKVAKEYGVKLSSLLSENPEIKDPTKLQVGYGVKIPKKGESRERYSISEEGIDLIKKYENFEPKAYSCPAGVLTIGYGHTKDVEEGQTITREKAEELFKEDLSWVEDAVNENVTVDLTQNQYDALCSFVYNLGGEQFKKSLTLKHLNQENYQKAEECMKYWTNGGLKGLKNRRTEERKMFRGE